MQLGSMFINNFNITLHVSGALIPLNAAYHTTTDQPSPLASQSYTQYDLVRKPSTLDALIGYFTPSVSSINVHTHCISLNCYWYSPVPIISSKQ